MKPLWARLSEVKQRFFADSLFKNASFLMASTAIMSVLGFGFWLFVAHLYSPAQIGEASALIAITLLISNLSLLGLNSGLVRFLPESRSQSRDINAAMATVGLVAMVASAVYLAIAHVFHANTGPFAAHPWSWALFMVLMATVALNTLTDAIFIANRRAEFHTIVYGVFGTVKLILPLFLVPFGSMGVFAAYMISVVVSLGLSIYFMKRYFGYEMGHRPNWRLLSMTRAYASSNYIGVILSGLPAQLMPLIIINRIGAAEAAYFSMAWAMANLLYVIPSSLSQSLLAETANRPALQRRHIIHATKILAAILVPVVLGAVVVAPHLLQVFGKQYSGGGTTIFQIMALSTFFVAINNLGNTILNIEKRSTGIIIIQLTGVVVALGTVQYLIRYGLTGVGIAMLLGYVASNGVYALMHLRNRHRIRERLQERTRAAGFGPSRNRVGRLLKHYGINAFEFAEITTGAPNTTLQVSSAGRKYVLRIYQRDAKSDAEITEEITFINYLATKSIPVPGVLENQQGTYVSTETIDGVRWRFILMAFELGEHPQQYSLPLLSNMAELQARIHLDGAAYAETRPNAPSAAPSGTLRRISPLKYASKGYSHFDFDGSNLLVQNNAIACILDFEGSRYDALVVCTYYTLAQLYQAVGDTGTLEHYLASYQKVRRLQTVEKFILRIALALRFRAPRMLVLQV